MNAPSVSLTRSELKNHPLPPIEAADKDERGKLLVIAGSRETPGSAVLCATAALRSGCGKVTIATVRSMAAQIAIAVPEAKLLGVAEGRDGGFARGAIAELERVLDQYDAIVAGPGMKRGGICKALAERLLAQETGQLVLDAAMLYELAPHRARARADEIPILLPHDREMAALLGCDPEDVNARPLHCGLECAGRYLALTLVKGPESHIVALDGRSWRFKGGGPGLGISGSGDTLAGIVGGLLARGAEPLTALLWGVLLHGEAGAALSKKIGPVGFLAREIADEIPALLAR